MRSTSGLAALSALALVESANARCRSQPGDSTFPTSQDWADLNSTVDGRLLAVVPSAKACADIGCTPEQWASAVFRNTLPGQMNVYNWEQNYTANPAELCLYNDTSSCSQGDVPLYAINATEPEHLQAGVTFASQHDLRVAVKSSGHDYLGRSTARNSLLLWTQYFQDVNFTESFTVGDQDKGSAVTVGSGVGLKTIYAAAKEVNKTVVGGTAATVSAGGGYTQGAGHSAFSPLYGLAADNVLQYEIVLANGSFVTANEVSNTDLFWALRGGGAGSWGVITSVTMQTHPAFTVSAHRANILFNSTAQAAAAMTVHAQHVFDYDTYRAGQYFFLYNLGGGESFLQTSTLFANVSGDDAQAAVDSFLTDIQVVGATLINQTVVTAPVNDVVGEADDTAGYNGVLGSRLIPAAQYEQNPSVIGAAYKTLLDNGVNSILGHIVAGGKVAENANISSAILPKWRTAKTHVIATTSWNDTLSPSEAIAFQESFFSQNVPVLAAATGEDDSGAYSNEDNVLELDFKTTFFGPNYDRLLSVKAEYDPNDLFIAVHGFPDNSGLPTQAVGAHSASRVKVITGSPLHELHNNATQGLAALSLFTLADAVVARCRSQPDDSRFPEVQAWADLNSTVGGRLIAVVPSAKVCADIGYTPAQWSSAVFRNTLPGQMNAYNWEQDYTSNPAELCVYNDTSSCLQGDVPLYAINATKLEHLQASVSFVSQYDLRVAVKSSGHDYLGRSTARNSLLLWTQYLQDVNFTDSFIVGGQDKGSAVTVGSGVGLKAIYAAAKEVGKMIVGGTAATVSAGGGYTQGAGHSAFSPIYGLAADNTLQYEIVLANGSFVTANEVTNTDLFWALRGGGAGSWGVITSITMQTHPIFNASAHVANILFNSTSQAAAAMTVHAQHIFDLDALRAGQYFFVYNLDGGESLLQMSTLFANISGDDAQAAIAPSLADVQAVGASILNQTVVTALVNDIVGEADDNAGFNNVLVSRLIPATQYEHNPSVIGAAYKTLLEQGVNHVLGHLVAGGKVTENANISSAILPKWRTAKTHVIASTTWNDTVSASDAVELQQRFFSQNVPVLAAATGEDDSGAYSNEANVLEPDFKTTFFGPNYDRLSSIKAQYDSKDLFIVRAGVGSERWDVSGMCTV
ncbi:unnamed protein product [Peniophora sp. CBMAI 1063]|nr:unnamed protein product [Peniophora sp. CBMAI 1063]